MIGCITLFLIFGCVIKTKLTTKHYLLVICVIGFTSPTWASSFLSVCDTIDLNRIETTSREIEHKKRAVVGLKLKNDGTRFLRHQNQSIPPKMWSIGVNLGAIHFLNLSEFEEALERQGYGFPLQTGLFYSQIPRKNIYLSASVDINLVDFFSLGIQVTGTSLEIKTYKKLFSECYNSSSWWSWCNSHGHLFKTKVEFWEVNPKLTYTTTNHRLKVYGGPSFYFIKENRFEKVTRSIGFWLGGSLNFYFKKHPQTYLQLAIEYHNSPDYLIVGESYTETNTDGILHESVLLDIPIDLSKTHIGISFGWIFDKKNK